MGIGEVMFGFVFGMFVMYMLHRLNMAFCARQMKKAMEWRKEDSLRCKKDIQLQKKTLNQVREILKEL